MYEYRVTEVLRVVDGDTIDCRISLGFGLSAAFRFRLANIDTPEVFGAKASDAGRRAREEAERWVTEHRDGLTARTYKGSGATVGIGDGAFGRWMADFIADDGSSLSEHMTTWMEDADG